MVLAQAVDMSARERCRANPAIQAEATITTAVRHLEFSARGIGPATIFIVVTDVSHKTKQLHLLENQW